MESLDHQKSPYSIKGRIWINKKDECFLGQDSIDILAAVHNEGSINAAAKKLGMSYQHAWKAVEQMNRLAPIPVIIPKRGGKDGGGAELTGYGLKIINEMNQLEMAFADFLLNANRNFTICF